MRKLVVGFEAERAESSQTWVLVTEVVFEGDDEGIMNERRCFFAPTASPQHGLSVLPFTISGKEVNTYTSFVV